MKKHKVLIIVVVIVIIAALITSMIKKSIVEKMDSGYYPLIDVVKYFGYSAKTVNEFVNGDDVIKFDKDKSTITVGKDEFPLSKDEFLVDKDIIYLSNDAYLRIFGVSVDNEGTVIEIDFNKQ